MLIYLDNCCFNRPFDDQKQLRIRIETEAKLGIQEAVRSGTLQLTWSYILDFENANCPFPDRRERIHDWKKYATKDITENKATLSLAHSLSREGLRNMDALHVACAITAQCDIFITTDDGILKRADAISAVVICDPVDFVQKELP